MKRGLIIAGTFATGLAIGILAVIAIQSMSRKNEHAPQNVTQGEVEQSSTEISNNLSSTSTVGVGKFEDIFKHRSITEQHTALYTSLFGATEPQLRDWWNQSKNIERASHREIAQNVILRKLTAINAEQALRYLDDVSIFRIDTLFTTVFSEWAVSNLEGAIEAASTLEGLRRIVALQAILQSRDDLSEDKRRLIAVQLNDEDTFLRMASDTKAAHSIAEPKEAWNTLLNDEIDDSQQTQSLAIVAQAWFAEIGFDVLSIIYSEIENSRIRADLVRVITQVDPIGTLDYTRGLSDSRVQSALSYIIVREWARTEPQAALAAVSTYEPPSMASSLASTITYVWVSAKPYDLIKNIEVLSKDARIAPLEVAFSNLARKDPMNAIAMLSSIENYVGNTSTILNGIVGAWAVQQPDAAVDWVLENFSREDPQRRMLLQDALQNMAVQNPNKAFELAIDQPAPNRGSGLEYYVVRKLVREGNIEQAANLLPRVRENSQLETYSLVADELVEMDKTNEAFALGEDLDAEKRKYFYQTVVQNWTWHDAKDLYESLEELPTKDLKSYAAGRLIWMNRSAPLLTDDQIEHVKTFLISEDEA
ncbi:MAG: hypothetical protein F4W92_08680 [Gammaproteobacteria bacterium]|nr:hypothetical protein [Gammaproteobacteria bacterium]